MKEQKNSQEYSDEEILEMLARIFLGDGMSESGRRLG